MISIFRRYTPINLIYLVPFALLLCLGAFINLPENLQAVFFEPAIDNLTASIFDTRIDPATSILATVVLTLLQGILLNFIINKYRSEEHTSELKSRENLVCRLLLEKKKNMYITTHM